jgi:hypothetical protein
MPMRRVVLMASVAVLAVAWPSAASAQAQVAARGPFQAGALGVEFAGTIGIEAWNVNGSREWMADGTFSIWWSLHEGLSLVTELHAIPVHQARPRTAFLTAFVPMMRFRLLERRATSLFVDAGAGVAWSDTAVPPRGTRFNFLIVTSVGVARQLTRQTAVVTSLRIVHLSNANRAGPDRNPDIEVIGGYFGLCVGF